MNNTTGIDLIAAERQRQIEKEGWSAHHDDEHENGQLARAGACYALSVFERQHALTPACNILGWLWPWSMQDWKPKPHDRVRELVKAGALIAAEIDRLQRRDGTLR